MKPGDSIGDFRVVGTVAGRPGTYRAIRPRDGRRVAVTVAPAHDWRAAAIDMLRAARLTEALQHPGIARVVGRGLLADRRPWLATELADGMSLAELFDRRRMSALEVVPLLRDLADVLAHAHARGVVHQRLTPEAIVLATGTRAFPVCVGDWGHGDGAACGKIDVLALGAIAYRALVGADHHAGHAGVTSVAGAPASLASLVLAMLSPDPAMRPDAAAVAAVARGMVRPTTAEIELDDADLAPLPPPIPRRPRWTPPPVSIVGEASPQQVREPVGTDSKLHNRLHN